MSRNRELLRRFRAARARFYPADFHVHSPASPDVRLSPHLGQLAAEVQKALDSIPISTTHNSAEYEARVISCYPPSKFYNSLLAQRDAILSEMDADDEDNWAVVALTDHNVCKYSCGCLTSLGRVERESPYCYARH